MFFLQCFASFLDLVSQLLRNIWYLINDLIMQHKSQCANLKMDSSNSFNMEISCEKFVPNLHFYSEILTDKFQWVGVKVRIITFNLPLLSYFEIGYPIVRKSTYCRLRSFHISTLDLYLKYQGIAHLYSHSANRWLYTIDVSHIFILHYHTVLLVTCNIC